MREKIVANVQGRNGYIAKEIERHPLEHPDLSGSWRVLTDGSKYLLFLDEGRLVRFVEFVPCDAIIFYKTREWSLHPRKDNLYNLAGVSTRSYYTRMPTSFGQKLKDSNIE